MVVTFGDAYLSVKAAPNEAYHGEIAMQVMTEARLAEFGSVSGVLANLERDPRDLPSGGPRQLVWVKGLPRGIALVYTASILSGNYGAYVLGVQVKNALLAVDLMATPRKLVPSLFKHSDLVFYTPQGGRGLPDPTYLDVNTGEIGSYRVGPPGDSVVWTCPGEERPQTPALIDLCRAEYESRRRG